MWRALAELGFGGGRVLEPGCGSGNLIAHAPAAAAVTGIERDPATAAVARALYPTAEIHTGPFEQYRAPGEFDAVIANVPFAKVTPVDDRYNRGRHSLHNYFLVKSLALTRPGGIMLALTSLYSLDARNPAARRELAQLGDLIGALRLPTGAMRAVAGTDAIMDLVVLRRRAPGDSPGGVARWDRTVDVDVTDEATGEVATTAINRYFADHPDHILGNPVVGRGMYRDGELRVRSADLAATGTDVAAGLAAITATTDLRYQPAEAPAAAPARTSPRIGDVALRSDRRVPHRQGSFVVSQSGVIYQHKDGLLRPGDVPKRSTDEVRALIALRDATVDLLDLEASDAPAGDIEAGRRTLRDRYERYRHRWGPLNRVTWARTGRINPLTGEDTLRRLPARLGGFRADPDWPTVSAVEIYDDDLNVASAAPILRQRTIHPPARRLGADTADEALAITLDETGHVDLDRIAGLLGIDVDTARIELAAHVFDNPATGALVPAEEYLAGDVRTKLAAATAATAGDERFARNVTALEAVQPAQLGPNEIVVRPGAPWIDTDDIAAFVREILGAERLSVRHIESIGVWDIELPLGGRHSVAMTAQWGTERMSADQLFEACLNQRLVRITDEIDGRRVLNVDATTAAREKQEQLAERFSAWVWEDPDRTQRVAERYNALFNSYVPPTYTGEHLALPGLAATFVPHDHQRAAVARIVREGRSLLAHAVGAGKTATMVMAGMEMRRLGLVDRPAYVVPNHMLEQFSRELLQLYPQARVLITTRDLATRDGRKNFVARAATGDWDAVVITHSAFERLPLRAESYKGYTDSHLAQVRAQLNDALEQGGGRRLVKRLEAAIARAETKLERLLATAAKDDGVCFEETGIDYLFVDELHLFKNKPVSSSIDGIRGDGSQRALDLDAKLWTLRRSHGHRILCGATATPIANSVTEAWIMQTYSQPDVLDATGLAAFDAWAATFGQTVPAIELAPDGGSYRVTSRLARYRNVPELIAMFRRTADVRTRADLTLTLPSLRNDRATVVVVPSSPGLDAYVKTLVARAEAIRAKAVEPTEDNMLKVTSDGRHAALDLRLVDEDPDPTGGKLEAAARHIARIHHDIRQLTYLDEAGQPAPRPGGLQIVFCDLSTPKTDGSWSAYDELKGRLAAYGVPPEQVAFIHDARNDEARARLFARCRSGHIAVLVGSTEKMGVGTNIHTRAVALHHIDCPWRPADIEQREGRIIRQGNQNPRVEIIRYATQGSFDVYMWQTCERKAGFIDQVMRGDVTGRDLDDVGDAVLSYAEVKALATGNPLVIEQAGVQAELNKLERLARAHRLEQHRLGQTIHHSTGQAAACRVEAALYDQAIARRVDTSGDRFSMEIDGTRHTKRVDAGAVLLACTRDALHEAARHRGDHEGRPRVLGRLGGFPVELEAYKIGQAAEARLKVVLGDEIAVAVRIRPEDLGTKQPDKLVGQLEAPLRKLEDRRDTALADAADMDQHIADAQARSGLGFAHQERLDQLRARHQEILDDLNTEAAPPAPENQLPPAEPANFDTPDSGAGLDLD